MKTHIFILSIVFLLAGCSGQVTMIPMDSASVSTVGTDSAPNVYKGVIVYLPMQVIERDRLTQIKINGTDKDKTVLLSSKCTSVMTDKLVTVVDHAHPYLLNYAPGVLESYTFSSTFTSDGALASVNTQSTPDQGKTLSNIATTIATLGLIPKAPTTAHFTGSNSDETSKEPPCTEGAVLVGYFIPPKPQTYAPITP